MIDLSFLTQEEQEAILAVLRRDAELKRAEEQRVQNLQKIVNDKGQLRYLTGEWFYEAKQLRHQDRIHGSDIIRASMRHTHKPLTILELSQTSPEKPRFLNDDNKEVFVPPVLRGVLQEPLAPLADQRYHSQNPFETPRDNEPKLVLQSPTKLRKNPFDSEATAGHTLGEQDQLEKTPNAEPLSSSYSCICDLKQDPNDSLVTQNVYESKLMPESRAVSASSQDCYVEVEGPGGRETNSAARRGILKQFSASSPADSPFSCLDPQSQVSLDSPTETWIDRKQVRFSPAVGRSGVRWQDGKEPGEHSLLDIDLIPPSEADIISENHKNNGGTAVGKPSLSQSQVDSREGELSCKNEAYLQQQDASQHQIHGDVSEHHQSEFSCTAVSGLIAAECESGKPVHLDAEPEEDRHSEVQATDLPTGHNINHQKPPGRSTDVHVEATSDTKPSMEDGSKGLSHAVSPKPRQRLSLGFFRRAKDETAEVQSPQKEEGMMSEQKGLGNDQNLSQGAADVSVDKPVRQEEAELSEMTEVRTLHLTAVQNTPFKEPVTSVDADRVVQLPERLSNLKASHEKENSGPRIIFAREEAGIEALHGPQPNSEVERPNNNLSPQMEMTTTDTAGTSHETPETECSLLVDLSKEDGTYRANLVLIYEETEDSLTTLVTKSQIYEPRDDDATPVPSSVAFNTQAQEGDIPAPLPRQSSPQGDKPAKISELKHFWEKEYKGPRVNAARVKEGSISLVLGNKEVLPQPGPRTSSGDRDESEGKAQTSPYQPKSNVVLKSLKVTDKGFVSQSPARSQLKSSGDVESTCHRYQVESDTEAQQKPPSPWKSQTQRSKDHDNEVRRSPSKTCHPRVLPRESSLSPKRSRLEGSPLKTFPIDIDARAKVAEEHREKPKPAPRQRKNLAYEAKQTETEPSVDMASCPLPLHPEGSRTFDCTQQSSLSSSTSPQSKKAKKVGTFTRLARSFIPQDYQHYLGPQEKAHVPPFYQEKAAAAESDAVHKPQNALRDSLVNQSDNPTEDDHPGITSWIAQNKNGKSSCDITARAWSPSWAGSFDETCIVMSSSKSLENLTSQTSEERSQNHSRKHLRQSVDDVSSLPPSAFILSDSKQMQASVSVPALQQDETDSDSTFEANLGWRRNTGSSTSNLSLSSGMASMSSVSGSVNSLYPTDFGDVEVQGSIQFAANYIQKLEEFHIFVVHCRDLAVANTKKNRSDPYVKCYLLPDETKLGKRKTTVKKKSLNPTYNEILRFKILMEVLKTRILNISVWHNDTFGRNSFLGEVDLDLSEWDFSNTQMNEYALKARISAQTSSPSPSHLMDSRGQMRVALRFLPQTSHRTSRIETGEVQIWVKDCKNLQPVRGVIMDSFVKCTVLPDTSRKSRQKTRVVKRTANPMFNHTMVYDGFRTEDLREACAEITVWDHDRLNSRYIGGLRLGLGTGKSYGMDVVWMDSTTAEANLWQRMLQSGGEWAEDVLPLRMLAMAKSTSK